MAQPTISSFSNPKIKELKALYLKSSHRRREQLFVVEGVREITQALLGQFKLESLFHSPTILKELPTQLQGYPTFTISEKLYESVAYRKGVEGVIALFHWGERTLESIKLSNNPLIMVVESVEKPGNLGAIIRSADGANLDATILCNPNQELYNPNTIRASLGALFSNQVVATTSEECYNWLKKRGVTIVTTELEGSQHYYHSDLTGPTAIVVGSEADGLTQFWRERADKRVKIPMLGNLDSLNVSVSAALLSYEAVRQRDQKSEVIK